MARTSLWLILNLINLIPGSLTYNGPHVIKSHSPDIRVLSQEKHTPSYDEILRKVHRSYDLPVEIVFPNATPLTDNSVLRKQKLKKTDSSTPDERAAELLKSYNLEGLQTSFHSGKDFDVEFSSESEEIEISVDGRNIEGPFDHIWRSTGLCPPDPHSEADKFLLSPDELQNLALIGSLPNDAIVQVRIHWLLDLVNVSMESAGPKYDYTHLDRLMDHLRKFDLKPGFEIMGNPGNLFVDFENATQVWWWRDLIAQTAQRYADKFDVDWVASWNWETWNEPDHHDFDALNFTLQGFLNYYDASRMGLNDVSPDIILGGPGGACRKPSYSIICWGLLEHCNNGSNFFIPGTPPRIDYISFHKKGNQDADTILEIELPTVAQIYDQYPSLRHVPVMNDEADFEVGWSKGREWRADVRYAALAVRAVYIHHFAKTNIPHFNYSLMSLDNAFMNYRPYYFEQRTLLTRFQINTTIPHQVQFVKKPAYVIMALFSLLGDQIMNSTASFMDDRLSVLSTCRNCVVANSANFLSSGDMKTESDAMRADGIDNQSGRLVRQTETVEENPTLATRNSKSSDSEMESEEPDWTVNQSIEETGDSTGHSETQQGEVEHFRYYFNSDGGQLEESKKPTSDHQSASSGSWEATFVFSSSNGTEKDEDEILKLKVAFDLPSFLIGKNLSLVTYQLRADVKGPYEAWMELGSPVEPNRTELAYIRSFEGSLRNGPHMLLASDPSLHMEANLTMPGVLFVHICEHSQLDPGQVINVNTISISSADVLITWSDALISTRCVWYYEVQRSQTSKDGPYKTISNRNVTDNNYIYSLPEITEGANVGGWYRVRVLTYWGSAGAFSDPIYHTS